MKHYSNKDIDQAICQLIRQDRSFRRGSKHGRLTHPDGQKTLTVAKSLRFLQFRFSTATAVAKCNRSREN